MGDRTDPASPTDDFVAGWLLAWKAFLAAALRPRLTARTAAELGGRLAAHGVPAELLAVGPRAGGGPRSGRPGHGPGLSAFPRRKIPDPGASWAGVDRHRLPGPRPCADRDVALRCPTRARASPEAGASTVPKR